MSTSAEWLEVNADRVLSRQRTTVDTAKLVATFVTSIGATLAATALQVGRVVALDRVACAMLAMCVVAAIGVAILDRMTEPDVDAILRRSSIHQWTDHDLVRELRVQLIGAVDSNVSVVFRVKVATTITVIAAFATTISASASLLGYNW